MRRSPATSLPGPVHVDAVNRRGRPVGVSINLTRLGADGAGDGVILMMQVEERS